MKAEYDFSNAIKNPYAKILKEQEKQAEDEKIKDEKNHLTISETKTPS